MNMMLMIDELQAELDAAAFLSTAGLDGWYTRTVNQEQRDGVTLPVRVWSRGYGGRLMAEVWRQIDRPVQWWVWAVYRLDHTPDPVDPETPDDPHGMGRTLIAHSSSLERGARAAMREADEIAALKQPPRRTS